MIEAIFSTEDEGFEIYVSDNRKSQSGGMRLVIEHWDSCTDGDEYAIDIDVGDLREIVKNLLNIPGVAMSGSGKKVEADDGEISGKDINEAFDRVIARVIDRVTDKRRPRHTDEELRRMAEHIRKL